MISIQSKALIQRCDDAKDTVSIFTSESAQAGAGMAQAKESYPTLESFTAAKPRRPPTPWTATSTSPPKTQKKALP